MDAGKSQSHPRPARLDTVDAFRLLAILGVVVIHTTPFVDYAAKAQGRFNFLGVFVNQLVRYAIPFFFVVSGYFWGTRVRLEATPWNVSWKTVKRLLLLFLVWSLVYALPYDMSGFVDYGPAGPLKVAYWNLTQLIRHPQDLIFAGTNQPLWFLVALSCSVVISAFFVWLRSTVGLLVIATLLYVFGVLALGYGDTPIGFHVGFNTLYGPFFGTLPFATGYVLSGYTRSPEWFRRGLLIMLVGYVIHFTEVYLLWKTYHSYPLKQYVFGTYLLGLGMAVMALSNRPLPGRDWMSSLGRLTLAVYLIHPIFVVNVGTVSYFVHSWLWQASYVFVVLGLSILTVKFLMRFKHLRPFLT